MYTVFARPQAAACSSAFGHLLPMKEHTEPDRTHTAGPRGVTVQPPSDSYFHILGGFQRNRKCWFVHTE